MRFSHFPWCLKYSAVWRITWKKLLHYLKHDISGPDAGECSRTLRTLKPPGHAVRQGCAGDLLVCAHLASCLFFFPKIYHSEVFLLKDFQKTAGWTEVGSHYLLQTGSSKQNGCPEALLGRWLLMSTTWENGTAQNRMELSEGPSAENVHNLQKPMSYLNCCIRVHLLNADLVWGVFKPSYTLKLSEELKKHQKKHRWPSSPSSQAWC